MDNLGKTTAFTDNLSDDAVWGDSSLKSRMMECVVLFSVPLFVPSFFLWISRYNEMGIFNLSIEDFGATVCAVMVALVARNWGKPLKSNGGAVAFFSLGGLTVETAILVECDSTGPATELVSVIESNKQGEQLQAAQSLAFEISKHSPGYLFWIFSCAILVIMITLESWIIIGGEENA